MLIAVHAAEKLVGESLKPRTARCRVRGTGIVIELDADSLGGLDAARRDTLTLAITRLFPDAFAQTPVSFAPYRIGSAFVGERK